MEGVDHTVDFRSTVGGFRRNREPRSVGTTPKPRWCHIICVRVWWEASRANMILRGVTGFTNHTYPARRFCSSRWKLPFRVQRVEPCENMGPNWVPNVPMTYPNTTKEKSPWSYPLSTPVEGVDDTVDFRSNLRGFDGTGGPGPSEPHQNLGGVI